MNNGNSYSGCSSIHSHSIWSRNQNVCWQEVRSSSTNILGAILCNKSIHLSSDLLSRICMLFLEGLFKDFALSMELSQLMIKLKWDRFNFNWRGINNKISWTIFSGLQYTLVPRSSTSNEVYWTELMINNWISGGFTKCF